MTLCSMKINHEPRFHETDFVRKDYFPNEEIMNIALDLGQAIVLFGNIEKSLSFFILQMCNNVVVGKYVEKMDFINRAKMFCDLISERYPPYTELSMELKRKLIKSAETRNILVHNGLTFKDTKILLEPIYESSKKSIDSIELKEIIETFKIVLHDIEFLFFNLAKNNRI